MITNTPPSADDDTLRVARRRRKEELGRLLLEGEQPNDIDKALMDPGVRSWVAGAPIEEPPEFIEHQCWRMLYVWEDEVDPSLPGRIECSGCGRRGRFELEYTP
jgi:hypothetical protein